MSDQYIVSARKYRPATFRSVVGQKALTSTLKNAIDSNRLAQAYLFTGPRGVGKTSCARIFAKTINCLHPTTEGEACGECDSCRAIAEGNSFNIIELDAASNNSVNDMRTLMEQVNVPPQVGRYRVFIIDEVHMLTTQAFNAFLKTLEEPPSYVIFIMATTEKHKVIPTILSRCQIYDFKRITIADMVEHLQYVASSEGIEADTASLNVIARKADGAMRDALSIFDQVAASSRGHITYESTIANLNVLDYDYYFRLVEAFRAGDVQSSLLIYKEVRDKGFDSLFFVNGLASHIRDLMMAADTRTLPLLEVGDDLATRYTEQARSLPLQWYYAALRLLNDCDVSYRTASSKQLLVELTLIRLCQLLNPAQPPFDRIDSEPPLRQPTPSPATPFSTSSSPAAAPVTSAPQSINRATPQPHAAPEAAALQQQHTAEVQPATPGAPPRKITHTAPPPAAVNPRSRPGVATTRLSDLRLQAEGSATTAAKQRQPVNGEALARAWAEYQVANADKHLLISAMRTAVPMQTAPEAFSFTVDHPALLQAFETSMSDLLGYLRKAVANDFITLDILISEKEVVKKVSPQQLLTELRDKNPAMAELLASLEAEVE